MAECDDIVTKVQDLPVYLIPQSNKFRRCQMFVPGDRIENMVPGVQEDCLRACYSRGMHGQLLETNLKLREARLPEQYV
jgi:hypothetical protein